MPMQTTDAWGSLLPKGIGTDQEASQATGAFRQSPWYQDWAKQNNIQFQGDPYGNTQKLTDAQQEDLFNQLGQHGIGTNNKYDQVDENGQLSEAHHKLRDALIAAAIGGTALTGFGAAGIGPLSGLFGAGAGAGLGGVEAGVTSGLGSAALPGAMASLPAIGGGAAGVGSAMGGIMAGLPGEMTSLPGAGSTMAGLLPSTQTGSFLSKLLNPNNLSNISTQIGSLGQGIANNRVQQGNFTQSYDRNMLQAQQDAMAARNNAMKNLAQANFIKNAKGYSPATISLNGQSRALPDYGFSLPAPSADQKQGGDLLAQMALKTLGPNGTYIPQPLSSYATPGAGETASNVGATIAGLLPTTVSKFLHF